MADLKNHQQIGQELELFFTDEIAPGAVFWLPGGMVIFKELEKYIRELTLEAGYLETSTPIMVKSKLFKDSGHWAKFGQDNMYNLSLWENEEQLEMIGLIENEIKKQKLTPGIHKNLSLEVNYHGDILPAIVDQVEYIDHRTEGKIIIEDSYVINGVHLPVNYSLKPMNCPESTILYRFRTRSYKELPLRLSEIGRLHRREKSGEIGGLLRVRQLTMDDAHIYTTEEQIFSEVSNILDMMINFYKSFGFEYDFRLATRPEMRAGDDAMWDKAEEDLKEVLEKKKIKAGDKMGDGAFYGPKIDVHIKDSQEREWQLATVQLDFHQPEAFQLEYVDQKGEKKRPVMIHRAIFGSFERFIGILTEHYQGAFPLWLAPVQVVVIPVTDRNNEYAQKVTAQLKDAKIRAEVDDRSQTMQARVRDAELQKVPYILVVGDKEEKEGTVAVRTRGQKDIRELDNHELVVKLTESIANRSSELV